MGIDPTEIMALDFDAAIMTRASQMERGELKSNTFVKQRQDEGFASVKALQERVQASYAKQESLDE